MLEKIKALLQKSPGQKAKALAADLGLDRRDVNPFLYRHKDEFYVDDDHCWFLVNPAELRVYLKTRGWLTAEEFEAALAHSSPLECPQRLIKFAFAKDSKMMIEALARLLAVCNQSVELDKAVIIDFSLCTSTLTYLNRVGFLDVLDERVQILPKRPATSLASKYVGNSDAVVELVKIDFASPNPNIPKRLGHSFDQCVQDNQYSKGAFTVLGELYGNVIEHADSKIGGFAGLQYYKRTRHIQAVISDSGVGIVGTLRPVLASRYPVVARRVAAAGKRAGVALLTEVFSSGGLSQVNESGRGLGLKRSGDVAGKFKATISVRQENFEFTVNHRLDGTIDFSHRLNLAKICGTHICFDLKLD